MSQSFSSSTKHGLGAQDSLMDKAGRAAHSIADQGREVAARVEEGAEDAYMAVQRQIRQQPLLAVGMGVLLGFALGALWKSGGARQSWLDRMAGSYQPYVNSWRGSSWWR